MLDSFVFWKVLEVRTIFSKLKSDNNLTVVVVSWEILFKKEILSSFVIRFLIWFWGRSLHQTAEQQIRQNKKFLPTKRGEISFFSMISCLFSANIGLRDLKTPAHEQFLLTLSNCPGFLTFGRMQSKNISSIFGYNPKIFHLHLTEI